MKIEVQLGKMASIAMSLSAPSASLSHTFEGHVDDAKSMSCLCNQLSIYGSQFSTTTIDENASEITSFMLVIEFLSQRSE